MSQDARHEFVDPPQRVAGKCYADGCDKTIDKSMLMCASHWFRVPLSLRNVIWESNYLAHPNYSSSRLAARLSIALKDGMPWAMLSQSDKDCIKSFGIGPDGKPARVR